MKVLNLNRWIIFAIIFLAPHIQFPGMSESYAFKPTDVAILVAAIFTVFSAKSLTLGSAKFVCAAGIFLSATLASILWGSYYLSSLGLDAISVDFNKVAYLPLAFGKLLSTIICFVGFYLIANSRKVDNEDLLRYWFYGLTFACLVHSMTYAMDWTIEMKRAGVSREGNFGGSYYLLSFYLMLIADKSSFRFGKAGIVISVFGILLSQSTTSILLFFIVGAIEILFAHNNSLRNKVKLAMMLGIFGFLISIIFGDVLFDKLMGSDFNYITMSRYDRLSSIISGLKMFQHSPILGVGIQGYSFALPMFSDDFFDKYFDWNSRRVANNIYIEILAEQGLVGLTAFFYLLYQIMRSSFVCFWRGTNIAALGFISILFSWLAFPTYTVSFHWLGFALLYRIAYSNLYAKNNLTTC